MEVILSIKNGTFAFGNNTLFQGIECHIYKNDRICLVGKNGSGKSTLLQILSGKKTLDKGEMILKQGLKIHHITQNPCFDGYKTAIEYVGCSVDKYKAESILYKFDIPENYKLNNLSGGEARKISIAKAFASDADIILLDEPTNHLDIDCIKKLESILKNYNGTFITISHDRSFLRNVSNKTFWIVDSKLISLNKSYREFEDWTDAYFDEQEKQVDKETVKLKQEELWLRQGVSARRKRNQGRLKKLHLLREERTQRLASTKRVGIGSGVKSAESSNCIIDAQNISKILYNDCAKALDLQPFTTRIMRGDKIGLIGPNGSGKTTFIKMLLKEIESDTGKIHHSSNVSISYFSQDRRDINDEWTLHQNICGKNGGDHVSVGGNSRHIYGYLKDFMFSVEQIKSPAGTLSGGEKNRLALAKILTKKTSLLVLDEPTNDLDMDTLDLLEEILGEYDGTMLMVSHDRDFIDRLVTQVFVFDSGYITEHAGGYSDYLEKKIGMNEFKKQNASKTIVKEVEKERKPFGFNEKRALDVISKDLADAIKTREEFEKNIDKVNSLPYDSMIEELQKYEDIKHKIRNLEEKWLELEILRGDI
jgi:ABC transport system ATP-binding/permease protein